MRLLIYFNSERSDGIVIPIERIRSIYFVDIVDRGDSVGVYVKLNLVEDASAEFILSDIHQLEALIMDLSLDNCEFIYIKDGKLVRWSTKFGGDGYG